MALKWFGNDNDGLALSDMVGIIIIIMWLVTTSYMLYMLYMGKLTAIMIDFYSVFLWLPLIVVGSLFGESVVSFIGKGRLPNLTSGKQRLPDIKEGENKNGYVAR